MNEKSVLEVLNCLKETNDKNIIYKLLVKIRTDAIKNEEGIKLFYNCDGIKNLIPFLNKPYEKIIDVVLSTLGNCCIIKDCGMQAYEFGIIPPLMTIISNIPNPSIQGRGCRLLGNLAKHSIDIVKSIQENGAVKAINTILNDTDNTSVLVMAFRLIKQLWEDQKFQREFICFDGTHKIIQILLKHIKTETEQTTITDGTIDMDPNIVNIKTANGRDRNVSRSKLNDMVRDVYRVEKIMPEKKFSFDEKFVMPENKEILELIGVIIRCFQAITKIRSSKIAEQLYADGLGYSSFVFLANNESIFRANALHILSNLVSNSPARLLLGNADVVLLSTNLLTSDNLIKPLDSTETQYCVRIICLLTGDSCNRANIRYSGALYELVKRARETKNEKEFSIILYAFYQFRYDQVSTDLLMEHGLVPIFIDRLSQILVNMKVDHVKENKADVIMIHNCSPEKTTLKRKQHSSPISFKPSKKLHLEFTDPGSPGSSSGYGSSPNPQSPATPRSLSPPNFDAESDSDAEHYSPVCSDVDEESGIENDEKDNESINNFKQFDIFSYIIENCDDEKSMQSPSDTEGKEKENSNVLDANIDFEKNPVVPILILLHNASLRIKFTNDFVRPETLTVLLKLCQYIPKPLEKLAVLLTNILRHSKNFVPILRQNFVYELCELKRKEQLHEDCQSCSDIKSLVTQLMNLLGNVGESGYGRGEIAHFLLTGEKDIQTRSAIMTSYIIKDTRILNTLLIECGALKVVMNTILTDGEELSNEAVLGLTTLAKNLDIGSSIKNELKTFTYTIYNDNIELDNKKWSNELVTFHLSKHGLTKQIKFCKKILTESSEVFDSMLNNEFLESKDKEVNLIEASENGLKYFLHLLTLRNYNKNLNVIPQSKSMNSTLEAYELSIKYMLPDMELALFKAIKILINDSNALNVFEWSLEHVNNETLEIAIYYFLYSEISGDRKVKLFRNAINSNYKEKWEQLILDSIIMRCSFQSDNNFQFNLT